MWPNGYGDLGRLPWTAWADIFLEYTLRFGGKYSAAINLQINNFTNTKTIQSRVYDLNRTGNRYRTGSTFGGVYYEDLMLAGTFDEQWETLFTQDPAVRPHPMFNEWSTRYGTWTMRLGFKFSF